jgi:hypothetical protein
MRGRRLSVPSTPSTRCGLAALFDDPRSIDACKQARLA